VRPRAWPAGIFGAELVMVVLPRLPAVARAGGVLPAHHWTHWGVAEQRTAQQQGMQVAMVAYAVGILVHSTPSSG